MMYVIIDTRDANLKMADLPQLYAISLTVTNSLH